MLNLIELLFCSIIFNNFVASDVISLLIPSPINSIILKVFFQKFLSLLSLKN